MAEPASGGEGGGPVPVRLRHAAATHVGLLRKSNEDSYIAEPGLYVVCDGMGGARAGEVASATACRKLLQVARIAPDQNGLRRAVRAANKEIYRMSLGDPALQGMGTTMTAALSQPGRLLLAHVGDSRAYLLRGGRMRQVTEDHSLVGEMMRRGQLTPEQAAVHPHRSVITRALGTEEMVEPDLIEIELQPGDRLLLCTDGLSGMVNDATISEILSGEGDLEEVAQALVEAALAGGGEDNVTVLLLEAEACEEGGAGPLLAGAEAPSVEATGQMPAPSGGDAQASRSAGTAAGAAGGVRPAAAGSAGPAAPGSAVSVAARRRRRVLLGGGAGLALVLVAVVAFLLFNSSVYWVGTAEGQVALYRGLPYTVLGLDLYDLTEVRPTSYDDLDGYVRDRIDQRELMTKEEGMRFVRSVSEGPSTTTTVGPATRTTRFPGQSASPASSSSTLPGGTGPSLP